MFKRTNQKAAANVTTLLAVSNDQPMELSEAISMLLKEQGFPIDKTRLQQSISLIDPTALPADTIVTLLEILGVAGLPQVMTKPDGAYMPLLAYHAQYGWGRIVQQMATHQWLFQQSQQSLRCQGDEFNFIAKIQISTAHI